MLHTGVKSARALALASVFAALACSSSTPGAPQTQAPSTCSGDGECQTGFKCDREQRRCVCTGDEACPGQYCNAFTGQCVASVPGCRADTDCAAKQYCNRALRSCQATTGLCGACKSDAECGATGKCAAHPDFPGAGTFCMALCAASTGSTLGTCTGGFVCRQSSAGSALCYPPAGACGQSNSCTPDSLFLCQTSADCADAAQTCDQGLHECVAQNRGCPAGDACDPQQHVCAHNCSIDSDCTQIEGGPGYSCRNNACFRLQTCQSDTDCSTGQICTVNADTSKTCKQGCTQAADCPLTQSCNATDPAHPRCVAACAQNPDCPLNTICSGGFCVGSNGSCKQYCQSTQVCPIASACSSNGCCVDLTLSSACPPVAGSCNNLTGCQLDCANDVFPLAVASCTRQADCTPAYPGTTCILAGSVGYCQVSATLRPCTSSADCGAKGFLCRPKSQFCGSSATGGVCFPQEPSANKACVLQHR